MMRGTALILFAMLALAGCNTIGGFGQDLSVAGESMTEEAQRVERDL